MTKLERGVFRQRVDDEQASLPGMTRAERSRIPVQEGHTRDFHSKSLQVRLLILRKHGVCPMDMIALAKCSRLTRDHTKTKLEVLAKY